MSYDMPFNNDSWQTTQQQFIHQFFKLQKAGWQMQENFLHQLQHLPTFADAQNPWKTWIAHLQAQFKQASQTHLMDNWQILGDNFLQQMQEQVARLEPAHTADLPQWQERWKQGQDLWGEYQTAQQAYVQFFNQMATDAAQLLQERLQGEDKSTEQNWRMTYDAWVDAGEEAYAQAMNTEEYAEVNARVLNSLLQWKQHNRGLMNDVLKALNLPSYSDTQRLQDKIHQLQQKSSRQEKAEQQAILQAQLQALETAKQQLRTELSHVKNTYSADIEKLQNDLTHAQQLLETHTKEFEAQKQQFEAQAKQQNKQLDTQSEQLSTQGTRLDTQAERVEVQKKQLEAQTTQINTQNKQLEEKAAQLDTQTQQLEAQSAQVDTQKATLTMQTKQLDSLQKQLEAAQKALQAAETKPKPARKTTTPRKRRTTTAKSTAAKPTEKTDTPAQ